MCYLGINPVDKAGGEGRESGIKFDGSELGSLENGVKVALSRAKTSETASSECGADGYAD